MNKHTRFPELDQLVVANQHKNANQSYRNEFEINARNKSLLLTVFTCVRIDSTDH